MERVRKKSKKRRKKRAGCVLRGVGCIGGMGLWGKGGTDWVVSRRRGEKEERREGRLRIGVGWTVVVVVVVVIVVGIGWGKTDLGQPRREN
jgi:hypothetical protein